MENRCGTKHNKMETIWTRSSGFLAHIVAPMVDMSELPFRMLCRRYGAQLCYSPMYHAAKFATDQIYRQQMFSTCPEDRPLIIQFCANDPALFTQAAELVQDCCDGVDLNLGCPQTIAKRGHYGSFLQDDPELIVQIVSTAVSRLKVPVSCKIRVLPDAEETVKYAQKIEEAGAAALTVHGRTRDQKGHATGSADWEIIRKVKSSLSIPVIANGNINCLNDVIHCMEYTGCDGVMSAEGILHNPALFSGANPPVYDIALEFLDLCETYPIEHGHIRTHLFRIFAYCLPELPDLQQRLGEANTLESIRDCCLAVKERLLDIQSVEESNEEHNPVTLPVANGPDTCLSMDEDLQPVHPFLINNDSDKDSIKENVDDGASCRSMSKEDSTTEDPHEMTPHHVNVSDYVHPIWLCHSRPRIKDLSSMMASVALNEKPEDVPTKKLARSEKKRLYHEKRIEGQKLRRQRAKERKRERKENEPAAVSQDSSEDHVPKHELKELIRQRVAAAMESGQRVCVDLSMEACMSRKEVSKLAQQLGRMYGINRASEDPAHLFFAGMNKEGYLYEECLRKCAGFENYMVTMHEKPLLEVFDHTDIVYLSPDSPNVLENVDPAKVYILGGLVDEHIQKGQTQGFAEKKNITTARLPIEEYMQRIDTGSNFKKVLSINQVFTILLEYRRTKDWTAAITAGMPVRHGYIPRKTASLDDSHT